MFTSFQQQSLPAEWEADLTSMGFVRNGRSQHYVLNGVGFGFHGSNWLLLKAKPPGRKIDPLVDRMGEPGLWKTVAEGSRVYHVFELHTSVIAGSEGNSLAGLGETASVFQAALTWAMQTYNGGWPDSWQPQSREELSAWIPSGGLTVQNGAYARQGELICGPDRLALRFPIVQSLPEPFPKNRQHWLRRLLTEAQNRWRLVRLGFTCEASERSVQAEVDLTGIPSETLPGLMEIALAALRSAVQWVLAAAVFLADPRRSCRALNG
jgi:hypothetical protein